MQLPFKETGTKCQQAQKSYRTNNHLWLACGRRGAEVAFDYTGLTFEISVYLFLCVCACRGGIFICGCGRMGLPVSALCTGTVGLR